MLRKFWRPILWRWHKRIGLTLLVFILWLSGTGVLLNHTEDFHLAERPLGYAWLLALYGIKDVPVETFRLTSGAASTWLSRAGDHLYWNERRLAACTGVGFSVVQSGDGLLLLQCGRELLLLTPQGELVERIGAAYQFPSPITALGLCAQQVCIRSNSNFYQVDLTTLRWREVSGPEFVQQTPSRLPKKIKSALQQQWVSADVNWERLMQDLHAGRSVGLGPWLMDAVAALLMLLSLSGLGIWLAGRRRR